MRTVLLLGATLLGFVGTACRTAPRFPEVNGSAEQSIALAEQAIRTAVTAGADSLAATAIASARANMEKARAELAAGNASRAIVAADVAKSDADYAAVLARLRAAERARDKAEADVKAIPPGER